LKGSSRRPSLGELRTQRRHLLVDAQPLSAVDEDRIVHAAEEVEPRPERDAVLRDEGRAGDAPEDQRIGPTQVVRDVEHVASKRLTHDLDAYPAGAARPAHEPAVPV
jgi:hypothetical protein